MRLHGIRARLLALLARRRFERELDEELRFHLEMETQKNVALGMDEAEARMAAMRSFGGIARTKEEVRARRGLSLADSLLQDVRFAARVFLRSPGFAAVIVATLALGVGANAALYSVIETVLLRPLPFVEPERLVLLRQRGAGLDLPFSFPEIEDLRRSPSLQAVVEYHSMPFTLLDGREPERVDTGVVSAEFFEVLGVEPVLGRTFVAGEDAIGSDPVLLLSHDYWQRRHRADPDVVGRRFEMNDRSHQVIGVLPPLPRFPDANDVYMPASSCPFGSDPERRTRRSSRMMGALARLAPGASLDALSSELASIAGAMRMRQPEAYDELEGHQVTAVPLPEEISRRARPVLLLLFAATGFVLLIACSNVLHLTLDRASSREREFSMRAALGAGRLRLSRQLLTESMLLALGGGGAGVALAFFGVDFLERLAGRLTARAPDAALDGSVLAFALGLSLLTGIVLGLAPSFFSGRTFGRRGGFVVAQIAVSLVLLTGAGLSLKSLHRLERVELGFEPHRVLTLLLDLDWARYREPELIGRFHRELLRRISAHPEIETAALGSTFPLDPRDHPWRERLELEDAVSTAPGADPVLDVQVVSPDYFRVIGVPLLAGRFFSDRDGPVAAVNRAACERYWPSASPLGKRISGEGGPSFTIVGVVGDVRQYGIDREAVPSVYIPLSLQPLRVTTLVVRTAGEPLTVSESLAKAVHAIDPYQPVAYVETLEHRRKESIAAPRLTAGLLALFAAVALAITLVGLSGSLALLVRRRSREIGLRLALGASAGSVSMMVLRQGSWMLFWGLASGIPAALALSKIFSDLLFEVPPHDPVTLSLVCALLWIAAAAASWFPARSAIAIEPVAVLKSE